MGAAEVRRAKRLQAEIEAFALSLPEAWSDTPWDESRVSKVRKKIFAFHGTPEQPGLSVKLTDSLDHGRSLKGAEPVGYGLGRHGWTYIPFVGLGAGDAEVLVDFVEESYRAVAPKTLIRAIDEELRG